MNTISQRPARVFAMQLLYAMDITSAPAGDCLQDREIGARLAQFLLEQQAHFVVKKSAALQDLSLDKLIEV